MELSPVALNTNEKVTDNLFSRAYVMDAYTTCLINNLIFAPVVSVGHRDVQLDLSIALPFRLDHQPLNTSLKTVTVSMNDHQSNPGMSASNIILASQEVTYRTIPPF